VEIYGPEASGKTTLALHVIAEAQKQGGYLYTILLRSIIMPSIVFWF
jgi:RecA/RadA recombinase